MLCADSPSGRKYQHKACSFLYHLESVPFFSECMCYFSWPHLRHSPYSHLHYDDTSYLSSPTILSLGGLPCSSLHTGKKISTQHSPFLMTEWVNRLSNWTDCEPIWIITKGRGVRFWGIMLNSSFDCIYAFTREKAAMCQLSYSVAFIFLEWGCLIPLFQFIIVR